MGETLYLISCSDHKHDGGEPYPPGPRELPELPELLSDRLRSELFIARRAVRTWILDHKLVDREKRQGNRATDPRNGRLAAGPDFDEPAGNAGYLPACRRYEGRFFMQGEDARWDAAWGPGTWTLILSGLYGFLLPHEPIQNYSCHLADRLDGEGNGLLAHWRPVLTAVLLQLAEALAIDRVVDLLSEEVYQEAIDWGSLYEKANVAWYHRCFRLHAGPETLVNLGRFFREEVLSGATSGFIFAHDKFISRPYFDAPEERILFEKDLKGTSKQVAREGLAEAEPSLRLRFGETWSRLDETTRAFLLNSEYLYERNRDLPGFDFVHASIGLTKALEHWLNEAIVDPLARCEAGLAAIRGRLLRGGSPGRENLMLGEVEEFLEECIAILPRPGPRAVSLNTRFPRLRGEDLARLRDEIARVRTDYRNDWVHSKPMDRDRMEQFRDMLPGLFRRWSQLLSRQAQPTIRGSREDR